MGLTKEQKTRASLVRQRVLELNLKKGGRGRGAGEGKGSYRYNERIIPRQKPIKALGVLCVGTSVLAGRLRVGTKKEGGGDGKRNKTDMGSQAVPLALERVCARSGESTPSLFEVLSLEREGGSGTPEKKGRESLKELKRTSLGIMDILMQKRRFRGSLKIKTEHPS